MDKAFILGDYPAFPLDKLQHDRAGFIRNLLFHIVNIPSLCILEAAHKGEEIIMENILPGGGQCCNRPPVEGIHKGDNFIPPGFCAVFVKAVFPGRFNSPFIGLRAGVSEKDLFKAGLFTDFFRGVGAGNGLVQV